MNTKNLPNYTMKYDMLHVYRVDNVLRGDEYFFRGNWISDLGGYKWKNNFVARQGPRRMANTYFVVR
jgi:hypothetical protein